MLVIISSVTEPFLFQFRGENESFHFFDDVHAYVDGFFIHGDKVVVAFGQCLAQGFYHTFYGYDGAYF